MRNGRRDKKKIGGEPCGGNRKENALEEAMKIITNITFKEIYNESKN